MQEKKNEPKNNQDFNFNKGCMKFNKVQAPYNFIPLSQFVCFPEWGEFANHDIPFEQGLSGSFSVTLTAKTPICVGKGKADENRQTNFFSTQIVVTKNSDNQGNSHYVIPGSSLKGAIRNLVEIASFSKMSLVDDSRYSYRDLTESGEFYKRLLNKVEAGFLNITGEKYTILPCKFLRYSPPHGNDRTKKPGKVQLVRIKNSKSNVLTKKDISFGTSDGEMGKLGWLLQTGFYPKLKEGAHKKHFIFKEPLKEINPEVIDADVISRFLFAHKKNEGNDQKSSPWEINWKPQLANGTIGLKANKKNPQAMPGVPVFFIRDQSGKIQHVGTAYMPKLTYDYSVKQMIQHSSANHESEQYDFAQLLFGTVYHESQNHERNIKGRVSFGPLYTSENVIKTSESIVLNSPKSSYYPAYVYQDKSPDKNIDFQTYNKPYNSQRNAPEIRGWKRYWLRNDIVSGKSPATNNKSVATKLQFLAKESKFTGTIRFHNLLPQELGALLWALTLGQGLDKQDKSKHLINIGAGKPYGYGAATVSLDNFQITANKQPDEQANSEQEAVKSYHAFENYMNAKYKNAQNSNKRLDWRNSEQIQSLLAMTAPKIKQQIHPDLPQSDKYAAPYMALATNGARFNHFTNAKNAKNYLRPAIRVNEIETQVFPRNACSDEKSESAKAPEWL